MPTPNIYTPNLQRNQKSGQKGAIEIPGVNRNVSILSTCDTIGQNVS